MSWKTSSRRDDPREAAVRAREWEKILSRHADSIDELIVYKSEPRLDAVTEQWFHRVSHRSDVRIYHRNRD